MDICIMDISITDTFTMKKNIMDPCIMETYAWVTRPEHPKGAKVEVKRPEGPPPHRSQGPEGP